MKIALVEKNNNKFAQIQYIGMLGADPHLLLSFKDSKSELSHFNLEVTSFE